MLMSQNRCATCVSLRLKGESEGLWSNAEEYVAALGSCDPKLEADVARLCGGCPRYDDGFGEDPAARFMNSLYCTAIALIAAQEIDGRVEGPVSAAEEEVGQR